MFSVAAVTTDSAANQVDTRPAGSFQAQILMIVAMLAVMYLLVIRPQKKKEKENEKLRSNIEIGDEIITIGGIIGTVVSIKDDFIVLETSGDRNKIRITRWSIHTNNTALERENKKLEVKKQEDKK
ncbi:MAG: preprotein translocase subunit YajC [Oscillospiraceae bacterium]|nr:preprotein translocase subunit YajC [Oscillospiraceae bacterium]